EPAWRRTTTGSASSVASRRSWSGAESGRWRRRGPRDVGERLFDPDPRHAVGRVVRGDPALGAGRLVAGDAPAGPPAPAPGLRPLRDGVERPRAPGAAAGIRAGHRPDPAAGPDPRADQQRLLGGHEREPRADHGHLPGRGRDRLRVRRTEPRLAAPDAVADVPAELAVDG